MIPSPNIWDDPDIYEIENRGVDPDGLIEAVMAGVHDWSGRRVPDVGCGSGFHLPRFAQTASAVVGFEPYEPLATLARQRISNKSLAKVSVLDGAAQELPLADDSVDVVHARWAYFFRPQMRARPRRGDAGAPTRRHGIRDRQRRLEVHVRRVVPQGHAHL